MQQDDDNISHLKDQRLKDLTVKVDDETVTVGPSMEDVFDVMAEEHQRRLSIPRSNQFSRNDVMQAFQDSFELIGGVPRLAAWAHEHPSKFYNLYSKLFPSSASKQVTHDGVIQIQAALQPTTLDAPPAPHQGRTIEHDSD